jgi:glyoxylase-like metal-dependent hydrolase (beta-lactamase superfamily II)
VGRRRRVRRDADSRQLAGQDKSLSARGKRSARPLPRLRAFKEPAMHRLATIVFVALTALSPTACDPQAERVGELHTFTADSAGFDTHSFYYDTGSEVIVFDAQFTEPLAEALIDDIRRNTDSPIRWVVITHPNPDKFNGVGPLRAAGATVVASEATAAAIPGVHAYKRAYFIGAGAFTEQTYPPQATVDRTFTDELRLPLADGATIELEVLKNPGVASTQTVAYIPAIDALIVGDLVHHGAHAWLEGGIVDGAPRPDLDAWAAALSELRAWSGTTVYGGRGEPAPVELAVAAQQDYLVRIEQIVADYVAGVDDPAGFTGPDASTHWVAIAAAARAAFPERTLDYLISYGVYGLVQALLE